MFAAADVRAARKALAENASAVTAAAAATPDIGLKDADVDEDATVDSVYTSSDVTVSKRAAERSAADIPAYNDSVKMRQEGYWAQVHSDVDSDVSENPPTIWRSVIPHLLLSSSRTPLGRRRASRGRLPDHFLTP